MAGKDVDLLSEKSRKAALDLIWVGEHRYGLNIKGGLIGINLLRSAKAYKIMSSQARQEFQRLWNQTSWAARESVLHMTPFITRAYTLVPQNMLHEVLDKALMDDKLRIRNGELRQIVTKGSGDLKDRKELS